MKIKWYIFHVTTLPWINSHLVGERNQTLIFLPRKQFDISNWTTQAGSVWSEGDRCSPLQALDVDSKGDQLQQLLVRVNGVTFLPHPTIFTFRLFTPSNGSYQHHDTFKWSILRSWRALNPSASANCIKIDAWTHFGRGWRKPGTTTIISSSMPSKPTMSTKSSGMPGASEPVTLMVTLPAPAWLKASTAALGASKAWLHHCNFDQELLLTWFIVRRFGMDVDALQGKMFLLLEKRGDGGQSSATESFRPDPAAASSRV